VVAGLLHDVGKISAGDPAPAHFKRALEGNGGGGPSFICSGDVPDGRFACRGGSLSTGHPGGCCRRCWKQSRIITTRSECRILWTRSGIVYISNILAHQVADRAPSAESPAQLQIDPEYLGDSASASSFPLAGNGEGQRRRIARQELD